MRGLLAWLSRLAGTFASASRERELAEELESHLELHVLDNLRAGMSPDEARRHALVKLGGIEATKQLYRERRGLPVLGALLQDLRYGLRALRRSPTFTAVAVTTLALGIGANSALFGVVDAVLLRPLPFVAPHELVRIESLIHGTRAVGGVSYPDFQDWRAGSHAFQGMAVFSGRSFALADAGEAVRVHGAVVSAELFPLLRVAPRLGREFRPAEDEPESEGGRPVILSHALWQRRFGGSSDVLGRALQIDQHSFTVIGVMPPDFRFPIEPEPIELWVTVAVDRQGPSAMTAHRGVHYLAAIARLQPGVTRAAAETELVTLVAGLNQRYPDDARGIQVRPEHEQLIENVRAGVLVLMGSVGLVLLAACANLAGLSLSRAVSRSREIAIRSALGASRARVVQQLLVESLALSAAGAGLGLLVAWAGIPVLLRFAPQDLPRLDQVSLDVHVLLFAAGLAALTGILVELVPALQLARPEVTESLKQGGRATAERPAHGRLRELMVVCQLAVAAMLLAVALVFVQSFAELRRVDPGFDPTGLLTFRIDMPDVYSAGQQQTFFEQLLARLRAMPGVRSASLALSPPLTGHDVGTSYVPEGSVDRAAAPPRARFNVVTPDYFETMAIALVKGRFFDAHDDLARAPVVIVSESLARRTFGAADPLGRRIVPGIGNGYKKAPLREIVGVVRDVRATDLGSEPGPELYVPLAQCPGVGTTGVVLRTYGDPRGAIAAARSQAAALDRTIPLFEIDALDHYLSASLAQPRFRSWLLGCFAALAAIVAAVGLYGLMSHAASRRIHEIGVRMALGARPREIRRLVLARGTQILAAGLALGAAGALALARVLSNLLYGLAGREAPAYAVAVALLAVVGLLACWLPAWRATRVDPVVALRAE